MSQVFVLLLAFGVCDPPAVDDNDPRRELDTAIEYFRTLIKEERYEEFIDRAIYPSKLKDHNKKYTRKELIEIYRESRPRALYFLGEVTHMKPTPFKPLLKEYSHGMSYTFPEGGSMDFYKRDGIWYGAF